MRSLFSIKNPLVSRMATTVHQILDQFREDARNNRDLGDRFERLMVRYLELDPLYADRFSKVWLWNEWPDKGNVGDVGIDLVAKERASGEYCAIQCKFYLPEHTLSKADIDSFFTAAGRKQFTSGIIVSTTDNWGKNAEDALDHQTKSFTRLSVHDLQASPIDWSKFDARRPQDLRLSAKKKLRDHQKRALKDVVEGLEKADRGKLIMACGTGKTFTALKIAEAIAPAGHVLFLVPSLSLMSQSLREWSTEADPGISSLAVCSDPNVGKSRKKISDDTAEITVHDLAFPATTNAKELVAQYTSLVNSMGKPRRMLVVFSTYQSIDAVSMAQEAGLPEFDLIICDEAHRTTGVTLADEDESHFVKVHDAVFIKGKKRLYMTATPRIYGDDAKSKAKEAAAELASMDDPAMFGDELHRLAFGEAVGQSLLSDYKVLVLAVDEKYVAKTFQKQIADKNSELNLDDAVKITGCWNGLEKRFEAAKTTTDLQGDTQPMRRAVAFSRSIKDSKAFVDKFGQIIAAYKETHPDAENLLEVETEHVDGTFDALRRGALLDWLKAEAPGNTCRILSNARCLSEGVDVPALDSVLFLNPRKSVIDVVQSVGRVMRRAEGKRYGYIILPIGVPADMKPEDALKDNEKYKVVWQVLQALRAHDDRFNATINQLELNNNRPDNIQVIGVSGGAGDDEADGSGNDGDSKPKLRQVQGVFSFPQLDEWKDAIYAKIVLKCGDRAYWETWAKDIAKIAETHITRIKALLDDPSSKQSEAFDEFLKGLQQNLNPAVSKEDAIEMLAQHLITKPVFDALFANYAFTQQNPVSVSMQKMLDILHEHSLEKETATLEKFYASVRDRAKGLDNAEARQKVVIELYDEFFRTAFPRMAQRLGIVYTPVEVVDFIIRSVEDVLRDEFKSGLGEKNVHIIDPFTGTGTFLVRLLQSGLIPPEKLLHKYQHELHANEIVLLAYYIAAINIEETFHSLRAENGTSEYLPFEGICLTDTFQLYESGQKQIEGTFPENTARVKRQKASPIRVVMANPPYSGGQESENDNNKNLKYDGLDERIRATYARRSESKLVRMLYSSEIRALRWASDRIDDRGVVAFVTNNAFLDKGQTDGVRALLAEEFSAIYVFNLRGYQRTSGNTSREEGGKIFGSGSRNGIAIVVLVRTGVPNGVATINYYEVEGGLDRRAKLDLITRSSGIRKMQADRMWGEIRPNAAHDWINQRDPAYEGFFPLSDKNDPSSLRVYSTSSFGVVTNRDGWVYNDSEKTVRKNVRDLTAVYTQEAKRYLDACNGLPKAEWPAVEDVVDMNPKTISWTRSLKLSAARNKKIDFEARAIVNAFYRPFNKRWIYFNKQLNEMPSLTPKLFPTPQHPNIAICTTGVGNRDVFTCLVSSLLPDLHFADKSGATQCFPLYLYEPAEVRNQKTFEDGEIVDGYRRQDAITDAILKTFRGVYVAKVTKEDIFYYVYGVLHSPEYRTRFAADLKKMLPRIPLTKDPKDFKAFEGAGRKLAEWHLNYETVEPWPVREHSAALELDPDEHYRVQKMVFARPTAEQKAAGQKWDKSRIIYNSQITLSDIPLEAYDYIVNGKPAIEWIMERYQVTRDKASGIVNDPNDWCSEHNQPRYIIDLVKRIVRVSIETMNIVRSLPSLNER